MACDGGCGFLSAAHKLQKRTKKKKYIKNIPSHKCLENKRINAKNTTVSNVLDVGPSSGLCVGDQSLGEELLHSTVLIRSETKQK